MQVVSRGYERYPTHQDGRRLTNAKIVPIVVNTFGAVGVKAQEYFKLIGSHANELINLVSVMGVYGSAEKVLLIHSPSKMAKGPPAAAGPRVEAAGAQAERAAAKRPKQARVKAAPKQLAGKFAAPVRRAAAAKEKPRKK